MKSSDPTASSPPRVFISYSHDSDEHCARVLALAEQLRRDGLDARIDQFEASPSEGWPIWCARQILDADFVLLACTKSYRERFLGLDGFGRGRGVRWEGKIIQNILYFDEVSTGFIPVVFEPGDDQYIPETVKEASWVHVQTTSFEESGYGSLRLRLGGRRRLPPLDPLQPLEAIRRRDDASIPTQEVWEASERIAAKLDKIQSDQIEHEQRSVKRHRDLVSWQRVLALLLVCALGGIIWSQVSTERIVTDPIVLRSKLEQKIDESFSQKLALAKAQGAPYQEIDQLYRWRDQTLARLDESVKFIQAAADERQSSLTRKAAAVLQERGVDAALETLQKALADEGKRHKAQARELAEAALFKAELHETKFEFEQARQSIEEAVQLDYTWWEPHNRSGVLAFRSARWGDAGKAFNEAERLVKGETGRAVVLNNLAQLLQATNRLSEAEPLMRRALQIDEKSFGPDHPNVAMRLSNLAQLLQATNRLSEAELLMRRTLQIDENSFGPDHPNVARDLNNLAGLLMATNRLSEAEPLMRRALEIAEKGFGPEHPKVAIALNNLAGMLKGTNRLSEAEPLMRRALEIDEKSFGSDHPDVARDLNNLAGLLKATNRLSEAELLSRRHLVIFLVFTLKTGHLHPHLAAALENYGYLLEQMSIPDDQISERLAEIGKEAGFDEQGFGTLLRQVFGEED
ncbi:MAG: tetratricopeptide repeat protein [Syntrophobacteraceae bacterium]